MFSLILVAKNVDLIEVEGSIMVTTDWEGAGGEDGERMVSGHGVQLDRSNNF